MKFIKLSNWKISTHISTYCSPNCTSQLKKSQVNETHRDRWKKVSFVDFAAAHSFNVWPRILYLPLSDAEICCNMGLFWDYDKDTPLC